MRTQRIGGHSTVLLAIGLAVLSAQALAQGSPANGQPAIAAPAPVGQTIIGLVTPQAQLGQENQGSDVAETVRRALRSYLQGPAVEVVPLESRIPAQIDAEAQQRYCAFVLYSSVEQKASSAGGLFRKLAPFANALPMLGGMGRGGGGMAGTVSAVVQGATSASAAASQQEAMERMAGAQHSSVKSGDTITVEYRLVAPGSTAPVRADKLIAKAKTDGEDIMTPLLQQVANAVLTTTVGPQAVSSGPAGSAGDPGTAKTPFGAPQLALGGGRAPSRGLQAGMPGGGPMDCDQMATMPSSIMSADACRKMVSAQQAYVAAASDPSAMRAGDDRMTCADISAEMAQIRGIGPSQAHRAEGAAATAEMQAGMRTEQAKLAQTAAQEQVVINAAIASDKATEAASGGLAQGRNAAAVEKAMMERNQVEGLQAAERLKPKQTRAVDAAGDVASDMGQAVTANPRIARLAQLASERQCKEPSRR